MTTASVLIVEDEAVTALDLRELLEDAGHSVVAIAATASDALASLDSCRPDIALVDIQLADGSDGISVAEALNRQVGCPVIFLTAHGDSAIVARAELLAPAAYLLKPFNEREVTIAVRMALAKHASDLALRLSERRYATTVASLTDGVIVVDPDDQILLLNPAAAAIVGCPEGAARGRPLHTVLALEPVSQPGEAEGTGPEPEETVRWQLRRPDGEAREIAYARAPLVDDHRAHVGTVIVLRDITVQIQAAAERQHLEQRLQEAQRVESLGMIASGIAHDFNNILASISGNAELALAETPPASAAYPLLTQVMAGVSRASELTHQLLTYAGKSPVAPEKIDLNVLLREMTDLVRVSTGPQIELLLRCADSLPPIMADPVRIRQVILNLLTNAAEALPAHRGKINVSTRVVTIGAGLDSPPGLESQRLEPGPYVELRVEDSGCGMDAATQGRIFDPFFTTKRTGRGLGLAAVRGIVQRHRGAIGIYSAPSAGTVMQILLPALSGSLQCAPGLTDPAAQRQRRMLAAGPGAELGAVLIIDDEPAVRGVTVRFLERLGYRVVAAASGKEGIARVEQGIAGLRGALIDLNMPGESGHDVAAAIRRLDRSVSLVLMSGYLEDSQAGRPTGPEAIHFLQKPFTLSELSTALAAAGLAEPQG